MSRNLPPFAIALKQRQENQNVAPKAPQSKQFYPEYESDYTYVEDSREFDESTYNETESESQPKPKSTKKNHKSKNSQKQYNKHSVPASVQKKSQYNNNNNNQQNIEPDHDYLAEIEDYRNLLVDLQKKNTELETQVADLTAENSTLQNVQQDLIKERQISDDYFKQIDELKDALRDEQIKSKCFKEQVTQLESIVQSKNQQIEAKESMIHSINVAYNQMVSEYQANGLLVGTLTGQIRQYTKQISELETQIAELKSAHRNQNLTKRFETCIDVNSYQQNFDSNPPDDNKFANLFPPENNNNFNNLPDSNLNAYNDFGSNANNFNDFNNPPNTFNDFGSKQNAFNDFNAPGNAFNDFGPKQSGLSEFTSQSNAYNDFGSKQNAFNDFNAPPNSLNDFNGQPNLYNDFPDNNNNNNFAFDDQSRLPSPNNGNDIFGTAQMPKQPSTAAVKRSALVDNIQFEDPQDKKPQEDELDLQTMSASEMKEKLLSLQKERDEIERILNKAPPKGRLLAHVNREKEEKERELDALIKQISKIKYRLKVIKAL